MTISVLDRTTTSGSPDDPAPGNPALDNPAPDNPAPGNPAPCRVNDPELWFAESPDDVERAKALCHECPVRARCLDSALERQEPWGVWGGELLLHGIAIPRKRPRGRPRKIRAVDAA